MAVSSTSMCRTVSGRGRNVHPCLTLSRPLLASLHLRQPGAEPPDWAVHPWAAMSEAGLFGQADSVDAV